MLLARPGLKNWFGRFLWTAAQGAGIGIIFGFPLWCLAIIILGPIYGNGNMGNKWAPQVIKLVYGAIVGWVTNPVIAILALGSQADHHLIMVEHDEEETTGGVSTTNAQGEVDETIHEDQEYIHPSTRSPIPLPSSPGINTSPLVRPTIPSRPRAISSLSSSSRHRPPLTANVSRLSPLPAASIDLPLERPVYGRERGLTVSSMVVSIPTPWVDLGGELDVPGQKARCRYQHLSLAAMVAKRQWRYRRSWSPGRVRTSIPVAIQDQRAWMVDREQDPEMYSEGHLLPEDVRGVQVH
jgi:hypothetical protein